MDLSTFKQSSDPRSLKPPT